MQQLPVDGRRQNIVADQTDIAVFEKGFTEQIDQALAQIAGGAHIVDHDQIGTVLARVGQQHRLADHRQEQERVPHSPISLGKDRGRKRRKVPGEIGEIAGPVVERSSDDQQRVVPGGRSAVAGDLLPTANLLRRNRIDIVQRRCLSHSARQSAGTRRIPACL